jgi:hypothetical protein
MKKSNLYRMRSRGQYGVGEEAEAAGMQIGMFVTIFLCVQLIIGWP